MKQKGDTVAGKKIEIIRKDTGGTQPGRRQAAGAGARHPRQRRHPRWLRALAEARARPTVSAEAKKFMVVMNAATSIIVTKSPYSVRTSVTLPQIVRDRSAPGPYRRAASARPTPWSPTSAPGNDAEAAFQSAFKAGGRRDRRLGAHGGRQPGLLRLCAAAKDLNPESIFIFVPGGAQPAPSARPSPSAASMPTRSRSSQHRRAGRRRPRSRAWATQGSASSAPGTTTTTCTSKKNQDFVKAFNAEYKRNPDFFAVGGYDGMHAIYEALEKDGRQDRCGGPRGSRQGPVMGKPARADADRSRDARHRADDLHPQGAEGRRTDIATSIFDKVENVKDPRGATLERQRGRP